MFDIKPKNLIKIKIKNYISLNDGLKKEFNFVNSNILRYKFYIFDCDGIILI